MRSFNKDGSEGTMAGNNIRCVAKYLYDNGYIRSEFINIEAANGVHRMKAYVRDGKVNTVAVDMGRASFDTANLPAICDADKMINYPIVIDGNEYNVTCVSVGNPHCVVFTDSVNHVKVEEIGPKFEHAEIFPERINTEFVRVVNPTTLRMRVWERGNGETLACGTGACAAVAAAIANGYCEKNTDITVKLLGGDLVVNYTDERIILSGEVVTVFTGKFEY